MVHSEETKKKLSLQKMGNKNPRFGKPSWNKGLKAKDNKIIARICELAHNASRGKSYWNKGLKGYKSGEKHWTFGKQRLEIRDEKHWNWKGGIGKEPYSIDWTETLKRAIRERDNYICQLCGKTQIAEVEEIEMKLAVHHIDYNKKNCNPDNLITLCCKCHIKTNQNRDYWIKFFGQGYP